MIHLLMIADDLTGASDAGVQLAKQGVRTLVTVDDDIRNIAIDPQVAVLVLDIESRHLAPDRAAAKVKKIVRQSRELGITHFYKKTDSTLRGNIGAELEAVMFATQSDKLMFIPAHPKEGRLTRGGYQYVGDQLLHNTAFGSDPLEPIDESFVPSVIARQSRTETIIVPVGTNAATRLFQRGQEGIYIFDCDSSDDLAKIARLLGENDALQITAGPAGFAELLPDLLKLPRQDRVFVKSNKPLLVVNGSVNEIALNQIRFARKQGFVDVMVPAPLLLGGKSRSSSDDGIERIVEQAVRAANRGKDVVMRTIDRRDELGTYLAQGGLREANRNNICRLAADSMGHLVARILGSEKFVNLMVFGGDSSFAVMKALGCSELLLGEEILPGLALAELVGFSRAVNFITKPGGFGSKDVVVRVAEFLRKDK